MSKTINDCIVRHISIESEDNLKGRLDKAETKPYEPSFDYSNPSEVFKQFGENTKMDKEQFFESLLNETQIEVFPQNGKLQARGIGDKVVSSKTHNKMSGLDTQATTDGGNGKPYTIPAAEIEPFYEGILSPKPWSAKGIEKAKAKKEKQIPHKYSVHISDIDVKQMFGLMAMQNIKKDVDTFGFGIAKVAGKFYLYLWHPTEVNWRHPKMGLNELTGWGAEITLNRLSIDFTDEMADDLCHWIEDKEFMGVCSGRVWPLYASPVGSNGLAKYEGIMVFGDDASSVHKYIKLYDKLTNGKNALPIDEGSAFGGDISDIPNKFQTGSYLSVDLDPEEIMSLGIGQRDIRDEATGKPYVEVSLDESKAALFDKLLKE